MQNMISANVLIKLENDLFATKGKDEPSRGDSHLTFFKDFRLTILKAVHAHRDDAPQNDSDATQIVAQYT